VVHGGSRYWEPEIVTPVLLSALEKLIPIDPDHLPHAITGLRAVAKAYPDVPQVACFDTGFHRTLPAVARRYALPQELADEGVIRYGFHGLSYEYVVEELRGLEGPAAGGRVIAAHLGNGASMAAIRQGHSIDTTMGFSPAGGLVMGTRCGDLDPSVPLYLIRELGMSAEAVSTLVNKRAGLLAISETTEDMGDLLAMEATDPRAAEAVALFCYQARKYLAALTAALGGLDTLVFTAGIGEHAAPVRARICDGLDFLGIELDPERNARHGPVISSDRSRVTVRIVHANEELVVARHAVERVARRAPRAAPQLVT
jgi:acetate kinase